MPEDRPFEWVMVRSAARDLRRCPRREAIIAWLDLMCADPFAADNNVKPLTGIAGGYRRRFGDWRVSYVIDQEERVIEVFEVKPRGQVYR